MWRREAMGASEAAGQSNMSEISTYQDSTRYSSQHNDGISLEAVFSVLLNDLNNAFEEVTALETEFINVSKKGNSKKASSYQGSSSDSRDIEYNEILKKKGDLVEQITTVVKNENKSPEIPIATSHCYMKYYELLKQRLETIEIERKQLLEDTIATQQEYKRIEQQVETFKKLKQEEEDTDEGEQLLNKMFQEAKTDLSKVLSILYPEDIKVEFSATMAELVDAFMKNDKEEDQYVELEPETLRNQGIICLIKDFLIIEHPTNPLKYRLEMAE